MITPAQPNDVARLIVLTPEAALRDIRTDAAIAPLAVGAQSARRFCSRWVDARPRALGKGSIL